MTARILIVDGAPAAAQDRLVGQGASRFAENYQAALASQWPAGVGDLDCFVLAAGDGESLPQGMALTDFHGVAWTGSPFSVYQAHPAVTAQIEFARAAFRSGVPCFGSCWGLQVMTAALGGTVQQHPNGFEIGIARQISLTEAGRAHSMYQGKPAMFDALCIHQDEVCVLPHGARVLAGNAFSTIQAAEFVDGECSFWGVQYHPEFDLRQIGAILRFAGERLVQLGLARSLAEAEQIAEDYTMLGREPRKDLAWHYGVGADVLDAGRHRREFANWLRVKVLPRVV